MIRIGFQNINGIKGQFAAAHEILNAMEEKELDILGIDETNNNWTDGKQQEAQLAIKVRFGQGKIIAS